MSARTRRKKSPGGAGAQPLAAALGQSHGSQLPKWEWRTFPVYFAFALGGFIGLEMGILVSETNGTVQAVFLGFWAILLGFGISRITGRWMFNRRWARSIPKK